MKLRTPSAPQTDSAASPTLHTEHPFPPLVRPRLMVKRADLLILVGIGRTLSVEMHTPNHPNFDPVFPKPLRLTPKGPAYFAMDELIAWVAHLKRVRDGSALSAANDPALEQSA